MILHNHGSQKMGKGGLPRFSEYSGSAGLTSEENAKEKKETKATRFCLTPPHASQYENLYKQHNGTPRGQPVPSTHRTYPRSGHEDLARFFLQVVLGYFFFSPKNKKKHPGFQLRTAFFFFFFCNSGFLRIVAKELI